MSKYTAFKSMVLTHSRMTETRGNEIVKKRLQISRILVEERYEVPISRQHEVEMESNFDSGGSGQKVVLMTAVLATVGGLVSYPGGSAQDARPGPEYSWP